MYTPPAGRPAWTDGARRAQIDSVRQVSASLVEVRPEAMYDVAIHLRDGKTITLRINIGPNFPVSPPNLQLMARTPLVHRFLGQGGVVMPSANPRLAQWNAQQSLGALVLELCQFFSQETIASLSVPNNSPAIHSSVLAPLGNSLYSTPSSSSSSPAAQKLIQTSVQAAAKPDPFSAPSPQNLPPPITQQVSPQLERHQGQHQIPNSFPALEEKSVEELQQLLNQPAEFDKFFTSLDQTASVLKLRQDLETEAADVNARIAAQEAAIDATLKEIEEKQQATRSVAAQVAEARKRQRAVSDQLSVPALVHMLTVACDTAEQESHGVSFEGATSADVMERLRRYIEVRKRFHCRNAKRASLTGQK